MKFVNDDDDDDDDDDRSCVLWVPELFDQKM